MSPPFTTTPFHRRPFPPNLPPFPLLPTFILSYILLPPAYLINVPFFHPPPFHQSLLPPNLPLASHSHPLVEFTSPPFPRCALLLRRLLQHFTFHSIFHNLSSTPTFTHADRQTSWALHSVYYTPSTDSTESTPFFEWLILNSG